MSVCTEHHLEVMFMYFLVLLLLSIGDIKCSGLFKVENQGFLIQNLYAYFYCL